MAENQRVPGCRLCTDPDVVTASRTHTIEHDLIAMRNAIYGSIPQSEAKEALARLRAFCEERSTPSATEVEQLASRLAHIAVDKFYARSFATAAGTSGLLQPSGVTLGAMAQEFSTELRSNLSAVQPTLDVEKETCGDCGKGAPFALICASCWGWYYKRDESVGYYTDTTPTFDAESELRSELWLNHGCESPALYGDDGEMQCSKHRLDFRRMPIAELAEAVSKARVAAGNEILDRVAAKEPR